MTPSGERGSGDSVSTSESLSADPEERGGPGTGDAGKDPLVVVVDLQDRRPVWAMPEEVPERIRRAAGSDADVRVITHASDGSGDGAARVHPAVLDAVRDAHVYLGYGVAPELVEAGARLVWIHSGSAGVGGSLSGPLLDRPIQFTNSAGIHAEPIADSVLGMALHFLRGLDYATRGQTQGTWDTRPFYTATAPMREIAGLQVGIVGYGGVGRAVAARFRALDAQIVGVRRRPAPEDAQGPDRIVYGQAGLTEALEGSDVVVLCAPGTRQTLHLIDTQALGSIKPGAILINVGRGSLVDESALIAALDAGRLRGAALDVFEEEPLPNGHPLWSRPDVLITPHVSGVTHGYWDRQLTLIEENFERFRAGLPLGNLVDKRAGY